VGWGEWNKNDENKKKRISSKHKLQKTDCPQNIMSLSWFSKRQT
jgi:hypothetical protein